MRNKYHTLNLLYPTFHAHFPLRQGTIPIPFQLSLILIPPHTGTSQLTNILNRTRNHFSHDVFQFLFDCRLLSMSFTITTTISLVTTSSTLTFGGRCFGSTMAREGIITRRTSQ